MNKFCVFLAALIFRSEGSAKYVLPAMEPLFLLSASSDLASLLAALARPTSCSAPYFLNCLQDFQL